MFWSTEKEKFIAVSITAKKSYAELSLKLPQEAGICYFVTLRNSSSHAYTLSCPSKEEALALQGTIGFSFHFISFQHFGRFKLFPSAVSRAPCFYATLWHFSDQYPPPATLRIPNRYFPHQYSKWNISNWLKNGRNRKVWHGLVEKDKTHKGLEGKGLYFLSTRLDVLVYFLVNPTFILRNRNTWRTWVVFLVLSQKTQH